MRSILFGMALTLGVLPIWSSASAADEIDFAHDVLPILKTHCAKCHTNGTYKGGLNLDTREDLLKSKVLTVGKSTQSDLIARVTETDPELRMPPESDPLSAKEIEQLQRWIDTGLPWQTGFSFKAAKPSRPLQLRWQESSTDEPADIALDRLLTNYWQKNGIEPPPIVDDATFLRRVSLDLVGLLPTPEELAKFVADDSPGKRSRKVHEILNRNVQYADHWMSFWNDLLRNDYAGTGYIDGGRKQITGWLYQSLRENKPYDLFAQELLDPSPESEGFIRGIKWRGRVNASQVREIQYAQNITQVFLGINLKCASCHDSFIDHWKLDDAYGLAAVISEKPLEIHRCDQPTGHTATAKFLFPELGEIDPKLPRKKRLATVAQLMTSKNNGRFPRTIVNRLWQRMLGRGLVHPVDIMANPAWSEEILDGLATALAESDYDLKHVLALIANSRAYQSEAVRVDGETTTSDEYVFRGPRIKRMTAEQYTDAVWQITGTTPSKAVASANDRNGEPVRAALVVSDSLMRSLGRPNREQVVTTRPDSLTTLQALDLSNGEDLSRLVNRGADNLRKAHPDWNFDQFAHELYITALSRPPTASERRIAMELMGDPVTNLGLSDFLWSLFMLPEFQAIR